MDTLLDLLRDATRGGLTLGRKALRFGDVTIRIVVKIFFPR